MDIYVLFASGFSDPEFIAVIPEPASAALITFGALVLRIWRKRQ
jgi:hypothetical protein